MRKSNEISTLKGTIDIFSSHARAGSDGLIINDFSFYSIWQWLNRMLRLIDVMGH